MSSESITSHDDTPRPAPRVTVEITLWILIGVVALVLRLSNLDAAPLAAHEAREAMLAWRAATGQGMPEAGCSPLLFVANALLFALCGANDALARLWPVLFGGALTLVPLLFRQRIGRVGALAAGLYLAISPVALFASRQLDGSILVAVGGAVLLGGGLRFLETGNRSWLLLAAVSLALAVAASPSAYSMLLSLGLAWLGFAWDWPAGRLRWLWQLVRPHLGRVLAVFLLAGLIFAAGLGWNLSGVGAAADLLPAWFSCFGKVSIAPIVLLVIYEPLAVLTGLIGFGWLVWRKRRFGALLALWAGLGILASVVVPPQTPVGIVWIVLPLALFGGVVVEALAQNRSAFKRWRGEWVYAFIMLALWVYVYLRFAQYGFVRPELPGGNPLDLVVGIMVLVLPLLLLVLAAMVFGLASGLDDEAVMGEIVAGAKAALRGIMAGTGAMLLAVTFSAGWGCAHVRPADPRELLVYEPTAVEVRDLVQTLRDLSWRETGLPMTLRFTYEAPYDSAVAWYLRDFSAARRVDDLRELEAWEWGAVVVTSKREWTFDLPEGAGWVGRDFVIGRSWNVHRIGCARKWPPCNEAVEWALFRRPVFTTWDRQWFALEPEAVQWAVIWTYADRAEFSRSQ